MEAETCISPRGVGAAGLWTTLGRPLAPLVMGLRGCLRDGMDQVISGDGTEGMAEGGDGPGHLW